MIKKLHQLSKDYSLDEEQRRSQELLIKHNPGYDYKLWTDIELEEIIHHHDNLKANWNSLKGIQKSDLGRYMVLYLEGGFYCDTDFFVSGGFDSLGLENEIYLAPSTKDFIFMKSGITNYFIYSPPKEKFFIDLIDEALLRITTYNKNDLGYISNTTGKNLINYVINTRKHNISVFNEKQIVNKYCPHTDTSKAFAYHDGSTSRDNKNKSWIDSNILNIMETECKLRKNTGIVGNICQYPIILIIIAIIFLSVIVYLFKRRSSTNYNEILI